MTSKRGDASSSDVIIVGGGLVGLATARALQSVRGIGQITVLEKEPIVGAHQSGRNSGVLHSGVYYRPGSLKAELCREGRSEMVAYAAEHGIPFEICGKVIVATSTDECERLHAIADRARENGVRAELVGPRRLRDLEPAADGVEGLHVPDAGIIDFPAICRALAEELAGAGHQVVTGARVTAIDRRGSETVVVAEGASAAGGTAHETRTYRAPLLVSCAGLYADRLARLAGLDPGMQVVPFRGVYYELTPNARRYCRNLIYPVPDPAYPFLGVHFTRMTDGRVEVGPNAVLATAREGYDLGTWSARDLVEVVRWPGFLALSRRHWRKGAYETGLTLSKRRYVQAVRKLVPDIDRQDLVPCRSGIRAQALDTDGNMVDDFVILETDGQIHVCNAPSPAATASLAIGLHIANRVASHV